MKFTLLQDLFSRRYPDGSIQYSKRKYTVRFKPGRPYTYAYSSHYDMAERLELIPSVDIPAQAQATLTRLVNGEERVTAISGCGDTMRVLHGEEPGYIEEECIDTDEYGRPVSAYTLSNEYDPWVQ